MNRSGTLRIAMGSGDVANVQSEPPLPRNGKPGHVPGFLYPPIAHSMSALPSEADIRLILVKRAANDPKRTLALVLESMH